MICGFGGLAVRRSGSIQAPNRSSALLFIGRILLYTVFVKLFYTGPVINAEMLVTMLEKHGIPATQEYVDPNLPDDGDLNRPAKVFVPDEDYDRAYQLFYAEREDEL